MRLLAHRVIQAGTAATRLSGVNAFYSLHPGRVWLDAPPPDLGQGTLVNQIIEVPSGTNRVRSYLEINAPDSTPNIRIVNSVQAGAEFLAGAGRPAPWTITHGDVQFEFGAEAALAAQWQVELRLLLGYVIAVRTPKSGGAGILSDNIFDG